MDDEEEPPPDILIDEAYNELDTKKVKAAVEASILQENLTSEESEPDTSEPTNTEGLTDDRYRLNKYDLESYTSNEVQNNVEIEEPTESDVYVNLKKNGYMIKTRIEHEVDEIRKNLYPTFEEDKDSENLKKRGIPKFFGYE